MSDETKAAPTFVGGRERLRAVPLDCPLAYDGKTYSEVVVRRLTARDVADFEAVLAERAKADPEARIRWPLYVDAAGAAIPDAIMDALDADDKFAIDQVAASFLPRQYRGDQATDTQLPNGGSTAP
jgi:hypothetical protein